MRDVEPVLRRLLPSVCWDAICEAGPQEGDHGGVHDHGKPVVMVKRRRRRRDWVRHA